MEFPVLLSLLICTLVTYVKLTSKNPKDFMLFDIANTLSALRTWTAFVDVKDVILKAWRHLLEDTKD